MGQCTEALREYEALRDRYVGFEARYRHALLLKRLGRADDAATLFGEIVRNAKRSTLDSEQEWVKLARRESQAVGA
jgi:hypothetical protein